LRVLILHESIPEGGVLHPEATNFDKSVNLYAEEYMRQNSIQADLRPHSSNQVLKTLTKPFMLFFINLPDAISDCHLFNQYDALYSASDSNAFATELFRRLIHSRTPHVAVSYGLSNLLVASPRARNAKKLVGLEYMYKHLLSEITLILFFSRSQMLFMRSLLGLSESRTRFVRYYVDTEYYRPQYGEDNYVLSVGRDPPRDYDTLLRAFKNIDEKLRIVSGQNNLNGKSIPQLTQMVEMPSASLRNVYSHSKFVVLPIRSYQSLAGQCILLESMAMGKTVIATKCWGTEDYIIDGQTGFFVRAGDENELRNKIQYLLRNPEVAESIGKSARQFVEKECSQKAYSTELLKLLKEACNTKTKLPK